MRLLAYVHLPKSAAAVLCLLLTTSCGDTSPDTAGTTGTTGDATPDQTESSGTAGEPVDLSSVDACSLLSEATVQQVTGESVGFTTMPKGGGARSAGCFWGAVEPGIGAYIEVLLNAQAGGIDQYRFGADIGCSEAAIEGADFPLEGGTCPGAQEKVYVVGHDRGVLVQVLVNDANRPLTPGDLVATAKQVVDQL